MSMSIDSPMLMGTESPAYFSTVMTNVQKAPCVVCRPAIAGCTSFVKSFSISSGIAPQEYVNRAKVAAQSLVARNQIRDANRKSRGHEKREENARWC